MAGETQKAETPTKKTLYDKLWDDHLVKQRDDSSSLLYIDRHLLHEYHPQLVKLNQYHLNHSINNVCGMDQLQI